MSQGGGAGGGTGGYGGSVSGAAAGARAGGKNRTQNKTYAEIAAIAPPPVPMRLQSTQGIELGNLTGAGGPGVDFPMMPGVTEEVEEGWVGPTGRGGYMAGTQAGKFLKENPEYTDLEYAYNKLFGPTQAERPEQYGKPGTPEAEAFGQQRAGERAAGGDYRSSYADWERERASPYWGYYGGMF